MGLIFAVCQPNDLIDPNARLNPGQLDAPAAHIHRANGLGEDTPAGQCQRSALEPARVSEALRVSP